MRDRLHANIDHAKKQAGLAIQRIQQEVFRSQLVLAKELGLPVINIPGCPAHPDWISQIIVALAAGRVGDLSLDELARIDAVYAAEPAALQRQRRQSIGTRREALHAD